MYLSSYMSEENNQSMTQIKLHKMKVLCTISGCQQTTELQYPQLVPNAMDHSHNILRELFLVIDLTFRTRCNSSLRKSTAKSSLYKISIKYFVTCNLDVPQKTLYGSLYRDNKEYFKHTFLHKKYEDRHLQEFRL